MVDLASPASTFRPSARFNGKLADCILENLLNDLTFVA